MEKQVNKPSFCTSQDGDVTDQDHFHAMKIVDIEGAELDYPPAQRGGNV